MTFYLFSRFREKNRLGHRQKTTNRNNFNENESRDTAKVCVAKETQTFESPRMMVFVFIRFSGACSR